LGPAVILAEKVQEQAEPGTVVISEHLKNLLFAQVQGSSTISLLAVDEDMLSMLHVNDEPWRNVIREGNNMSCYLLKWR
jgi:hypothetical protein